MLLITDIKNHLKGILQITDRFLDSGANVYLQMKEYIQ